QNGIHVNVALSTATLTMSNGQIPFSTSLVPWDRLPANWGHGVTYDSEQNTYTTYWNLGVVDIDGNGRADLIAYLGTVNGLETNVAFAAGGGQFGEPIPRLLSGDFTGAILNLGDINGDGRMDVVASFQNVNGWQLTAAISNGDGSFSQPNGGSFVGFNAIGWLVAAGDLNGDGRTDFFLYRGSQTSLQAYLAFSKGDGTFAFLAGTSCSNPNLPVANGNFNGWSLTLADLNGDGRADLVAYYFTPPGVTPQQSWVYPYLSNGNGGFCASGGFNSNATGWSLFTPDLNGDGRSDIAFIYFNGTNTALEVTSFITPGQALAATSFTTGLGATTNVSYAPLTAAGV